MVLFIPAAPVIDAVASMKVSRQSANLTIRMLSKIPWKSWLMLWSKKNKELKRSEHSFLRADPLPFTIVTKLNKYTNNEYIERNRIIVTTIWHTKTWQTSSGVPLQILTVLRRLLRQWQFIRCQMTSSKEVSWLCCCILKENAEKIVLEIDIFPMIMAAFSDNVKVTSQAWGLLKTATGPLQEALQANDQCQCHLCPCTCYWGA